MAKRIVRSLSGPGVVVACVVLLTPEAVPAEVRTWTDSTGRFSVDAEFVELVDGRVRLRRTDGTAVTVPLDNLSPADQAYVRGQKGDGHGGDQVAAQETIPNGDAIIEFVSGSKLQGRIVAQDEKALTVVTSISGRQYTRTYLLDRVLAVTVAGRRIVLHGAQAGSGGNDAPAGGHGHGAGAPVPGAESAATPPAGGVQLRSRAAVDALIEQLGRKPPDWFESTPLEYPRSLDLTWPEKPEGQWNNQKNVGQYIWDVINPNESKWKSGIRFMHFMLEKHQGDPRNRARAMETLGRMYFDFFQDYPRAAFWWRAAEVDGQGLLSAVHLAECYWHLGNKQMAVELLSRTPVYFPSIKLWADMGETNRALQLAEAGARGGAPDLAYLYAGDACRSAGRLDQALTYYGQVLQVAAAGKQANRIENNQKRARANIEGVKLFDALDLKRVPDGSYQASSPGYAGDLRVEVAVTGGRIDSVRVTQHQEKQFYSAISDTTSKIVAKQGLKGIDATSGATVTSEAIINATAKALASGMK